MDLIQKLAGGLLAPLHISERTLFLKIDCIQVC